ncbi:hypothetical protein JOC85_001082 [Bacillus mesophilus]|nr:hypothetical protein [Bacillus mesophilus]
MKNWLYTLYFFILGVISFITREVVTFIMLGLVLISLNNIHSTLKEILKVNKKEN